MKKYNTITEEWNEVKTKKFSYGESMTDRTHYRPNVSILNDTIGNNGNMGVYQFKDGKDNGERFYVMRSKASDITEKENYAKVTMLQGKEAKETVNTMLEAEMQRAEAIETPKE